MRFKNYKIKLKTKILLQEKSIQTHNISDKTTQ